jgi:hypothetical protein
MQPALLLITTSNDTLGKASATFSALRQESGSSASDSAYINLEFHRLLAV